ncbi:MAG: hypothetical protein LBN22_11115 [Clostridiales Family XIII bacterium]|jgi:hypothetical protein|nr:hypothetical protein [Clostridiales Family XIII bacterium]
MTISKNKAISAVVAGIVIALLISVTCLVTSSYEIGKSASTGSVATQERMIAKKVIGGELINTRDIYEIEDSEVPL